MSKGALRLLRLTTGTKAKMIQSDDQAHALHITDPAYRPNRFKAFANGVFIGNIYESSKFIKTDTFIPVGAEKVEGPELNPWISILQCGSSSFNLDLATLKGNKWDSGKIGEFTLEQLGIALYNPDIVGIPPTNYLGTSEAWALLDGLPFNFVAEQPLNESYYDYDTGNLFAHSLKTKNMYDLNYNVSGQFIQLGSTDTIGNLVDTREYKDARNGGANVWLSYKVGKALSGQITTAITEELIEDTGTPIIPVTEYNDKTTGVYAYEMAERYKGTIVLQSGGLHKSNLFSIKIADSKLNESIEDTQLRSFIQSGINEVIYELMKKITPANTQLFQIFWEGD